MIIKPPCAVKAKGGFSSVFISLADGTAQRGLGFFQGKTVRFPPIEGGDTLFINDDPVVDIAAIRGGIQHANIGVDANKVDFVNTLFP